MTNDNLKSPMTEMLHGISDHHLKEIYKACGLIAGRLTKALSITFDNPDAYMKYESISDFGRFLAAVEKELERRGIDRHKLK